MQRTFKNRKMDQKSVQSVKNHSDFEPSLKQVFMAKEKWYRTGAVADETGISPYRLRVLAKEGLIESRSSNGMLYISANTVERLKTNGPPPVPARAAEDLPETRASDEPDDDEDETPLSGTAGSPAPPRNRRTAELYAAPSRQLAKSKERVIRLEHAVEAKRLEQQSREIDRLAQEERERASAARRLREWRDGHIRRVVEKMPGDLCAATCTTVEELLDRVPPGSNVTAKVDEIIHIALAPARRREDQTRAVEQALSQLRSDARRSEWERRARSEAMKAVLQLPGHASYADMHSAAQTIVATANAVFDHSQKIEHEVSWLGLKFLPHGTRTEDREEAEELARRALDSLPPGVPDRQFKSTIQSAIAPILSRIEKRKAQEERDRLEKSHRSRIDAKVSYLHVALGATSEERSAAQRRVRAALEQLPPTASASEVDAEAEKQLAPIRAAIQQREQADRTAQAAQNAAREKTVDVERKAESALSSVEEYLREYFNFDSPLEVFRCRTNTLLSRIGAPVAGDWNTRSSGPSDFTAR
jgi:hypothetical protein